VKHSRVTAIEASEKALEVARRNVQDHQVAKQVTLVESDLFDTVDAANRFDFILSNPPYVSREEYEALAPSVREFEPREALLAGERGTEVYVRLIPQAAERLKPGGWLILEISPMVQEAVVDLLEKTGRFGTASVTKDLAGLARVVHAQRRGGNEER